jgi:hypothetical protein
VKSSGQEGKEMERNLKDLQEISGGEEVGNFHRVENSDASDIFSKGESDVKYS